MIGLRSFINLFYRFEFIANNHWNRSRNQNILINNKFTNIQPIVTLNIKRGTGVF